MTVSLHKNFIESTFKTAITEYIHCTPFYVSMNVCWVEAQVLDPGGMTGHLEVEVTWDQHKTPWRSGLSLDEKKIPWR